MNKYILKDRVPAPTDFMTWATWFENFDNRRVANTRNEAMEVSTVFIGIDENCMFETCLFPTGRTSEVVDRYGTWDEAVKGHERHCREHGL